MSTRWSFWLDSSSAWHPACAIFSAADSHLSAAENRKQRCGLRITTDERSDLLLIAQLSDRLRRRRFVSEAAPRCCRSLASPLRRARPIRVGVTSLVDACGRWLLLSRAFSASWFLLASASQRRAVVTHARLGSIDACCHQALPMAAMCAQCQQTSRPK